MLYDLLFGMMPGVSLHTLLQELKKADEAPSTWSERSDIIARQTRGPNQKHTMETYKVQSMGGGGKFTVVTHSTHSRLHVRTHHMYDETHGRTSRDMQTRKNFKSSILKV